LRQRERGGGVLACSALKRRYRDTMRHAAPGAFFLHLAADRAVLAYRLEHRRDHFATAALLDSQLRTLEPLEPGELGATLNSDRPPETLVDTVMRLLA
jgi:gluconokinase